MNNPFTLFGLEPAPTLIRPDGQSVSREQLKRAYLALQAACHPDGFASASDGMKAMAEQRSAAGASAFRQLTHELSRVKAWFETLGFEVENQTMGADMATFELQMSLNESLDALARDPSGAPALQMQLEQIQQESITWFEQARMEESFDLKSAASLAAYSKLAMASRLLQKLKDTFLT